MTREEAKSHQLILLPRDHGKSALAAFRVAWEITRNPSIRVLYISSTAKLAIKQLKFIKDILTCDQYRRYWPTMVNPDEAKREKWTETEISVDHPNRKRDSIRDPTVFTAGLTTNIVGLHCDLSILDDVVVDDNAYSPEGREKVASQASYLASIAGTGSKLLATGTRYHPLDYYNSMLEMVVQIFAEDGSIEHSYPLYEVFERVVEDRGDGAGNFLWPKSKGPDGRYFGFDKDELARKRAQYSDPTKFRAQYYNNPNEVGTASITPEMFQYYNPKHVYREGGKWYYRQSRLNVFAAVDFAYSLSKGADFSAIVVIGVDSKHNYYVLDIDRFKTQKISDYFSRILRMHVKWDFRKIRLETTAAQVVLVKDLKENYIRAHGLALSVEENPVTSRSGSKEERIEANLQPKYANGQMWHYSGGHCTLLEEELIYAKPAHDDIKDALSSAIETAVPPSFQAAAAKSENAGPRPQYHPRFGGF
jgi:phage terminase large subunit-like protein